MDFPTQKAPGYEQSVEWIMAHFHPDGLKCPDCEQPVESAREFRRTKRSELTVYRCRECESIYNLYTGTVFQGRHLTPPKVVMFLREVRKDKPTTVLSAELEIDYRVALDLRHGIQCSTQKDQSAADII